MKRLVERIKRHEGFRAHRYLDTEGHPTIGYGHKITGARRIDVPMSREAAEALLLEDLEATMAQVRRKLPWLAQAGCGEARESVVHEMAYQMGVAGMLGFRNMLLMLKHGRYQEASWAILDSLMARQTPNRARTYARIMLTGQWDD